jgi:hypothetical protein
MSGIRRVDRTLGLSSAIAARYGSRAIVILHHRITFAEKHADPIVRPSTRGLRARGRDPPGQGQGRPFAPIVLSRQRQITVTRPRAPSEQVPARSGSGRYKSATRIQAPTKVATTNPVTIDQVPAAPKSRASSTHNPNVPTPTAIPPIKLARPRFSSPPRPAIARYSAAARTCPARTSSVPFRTRFKFLATNRISYPLNTCRSRPHARSDVPKNQSATG